MKEVVINKCYGGFGLSYGGMMHYAKLKGIRLYAYVNPKKPSGGTDFDRQVEYVPEDGDGERPFCIHYTTALATNDKELNNAYFSEHDIDRADPALIQTVREMGKAAGGRAAALAIIGIPDGVEWDIEEYDGIEWVAEKHQTWQ